MTEHCARVDRAQAAGYLETDKPVERHVLRAVRIPDDRFSARAEHAELVHEEGRQVLPTSNSQPQKLGFDLGFGIWDLLRLQRLSGARRGAGGDTFAASASGASDTSTVSPYFTSTDLRFSLPDEILHDNLTRADRHLDRVERCDTDALAFDPHFRAWRRRHVHAGRWKRDGDTARRVRDELSR